MIIGDYYFQQHEILVGTRKPPIETFEILKQNVWKRD
jgi:hypothetical protein